MHPPLDTRIYDPSLPWLKGKAHADIQSEMAAAAQNPPRFEQHLAEAPAPARAAQASRPTQITVTPGKPPSEPDGDTFFGEDGFTFADLIDIINPLQHIPIISTIYQRLTGDESSRGASIIGSALMGGIPGLFASIASEIVSQQTGKNPGEHVVAAFSPADQAPATQLAAAPPPVTAHPPMQTVDAAPVAVVQAASSAPPPALPIANLAPDAVILNEEPTPSAMPAPLAEVAVPPPVRKAAPLPGSFRDRIGADRIYGGSPNRYAAMAAKDKLQIAVANANPELAATQAPRRGPPAESAPTLPAADPVISRRSAATAPLPRAEDRGSDDLFHDFLKDPELSSRMQSLANKDRGLSEAQLRAAALADYEADTGI